ncbi:MAG: putative DNA binding domain-containing protein [Chloroflexi bacterium]|nr:putative DNA binding domain-containing protein [Chloroflexota bacterium]
MTVDHPLEYIAELVHELRILPKEQEWVEFKLNDADPDEIGEYLSALSNSAALLGQANAYIVWGLEDQSHEALGTEFRPAASKVGNEELENWLLRLLTPRIDFRFYEVPIDGNPVVLLEIQAASHQPVQFKGTEFIRVGSYKKKLRDYPEKERGLWRIFDTTPFERQIAAESVPVDDVLKLLDYPAYFDLLKVPLPESRDGILARLQADELISPARGGKWNILNLGAVLFAKRLADFRTLKRKGVRVILYKGESRVKTIREQEGTKGYAGGFEGLIGFIVGFLPENEVIGQALRRSVPMFPELAIRELVANAIIHQDFRATGTSPMIELFPNRIEITNPGLPLVNTDRFLDSPPKSRNEALASFMRRVGVCEERGSGIDKVVFETEFYQLPAPIFETTDQHTRAVLFAHREFREMDKEDRIRACYLHACLRHVQSDFMTNTTLRERFGIEARNSAMASRIIKEALTAGRIKVYDDSVGKKAKKYLPWWA